MSEYGATLGLRSYAGLRGDDEYLGEDGLGRLVLLGRE